jgi:predicted ABC-class ATPase
MKVKIKLWVQDNSILEKTISVMKRDGWVEKDLLIFTHDRVSTQKEARERLDRLGLLTSKSLTINIEAA